MTIILGVLWDCVPIMLILILHYKNFKEKKLTANELRRAAIGRTSCSNTAGSDDHELDDTKEEEVLMLDHTATQRNVVLDDDPKQT